MWNPEQDLAIHTLDKDICVVAGAGSGKTGVLAKRCAYILRKSLDNEIDPELCSDLNGMLVITFTNKATYEMRQRIATLLRSSQYPLPHGGLENSWISTIHGFAARILRDNAVVAGLDPKFKIVVGYQSDLLFERAFQNAMDTITQAGNLELWNFVIQRLDEKRSGKSGRSFQDLLKRSLSQQKSIGRPNDYSRTLNIDYQMSVMSQLEVIDQCAVRLQQRTGEARAFNYPEQISDLISVAQTKFESGMEIDFKLLASKGKAMLRNIRKIPNWSLQFGNVIESLAESLQMLVEFKNYSHSHELDCAIASNRITEIHQMLDHHLQEQKSVSGILNNDDLLHEAVRLLESNSDVRRRYQKQFRHILVDEFQDIDRVQWRLIELLHVGGSSTYNRLFIVGDPQQSIYGFRGADPTIFRDVCNRIANQEDGIVISLKTNYRSNPNILQAVNYLFSHTVLGGDNYQELLAGNRLGNGAEDCGVHIVVGTDEGKQRYFENEIPFICKEIQALIDTGKYDWKDICILFRDTTKMELYEQQLLRENIPFFQVGGGRNYFARNEIRDMRNLLLFYSDPTDDFAFSALLHSPFIGIGIEDFHRICKVATEHKTSLFESVEFITEADEGFWSRNERLRMFWDLMVLFWEYETKVSLPTVIDTVVTSTGYDRQMLIRPMGARRLANVRKLLAMAIDEHFSMSELLNWLDQHDSVFDREGDAPIEEEYSNVVRLITVHSAKGLEFKVVFLVNMSKRFDRIVDDPWITDPSNGQIIVKSNEYEPMNYKLLAIRKARRNTEESLRVLYVAMTRAKERLYLCGSMGGGKKRGENWSDIIYNRFNFGTISELEILETSDYKLMVTPMRDPQK